MSRLFFSAPIHSLTFLLTRVNFGCIKERKRPGFDPPTLVAVGRRIIPLDHDAPKYNKYSKNISRYAHIFTLFTDSYVTTLAACFNLATLLGYMLTLQTELLP